MPTLWRHSPPSALETKDVELPRGEWPGGQPRAYQLDVTAHLHHSSDKKAQAFVGWAEVLRHLWLIKHISYQRYWGCFLYINGENISTDSTLVILTQLHDPTIYDRVIGLNNIWSIFLFYRGCRSAPAAPFTQSVRLLCVSAVYRTHLETHTLFYSNYQNKDMNSSWWGCRHDKYLLQFCFSCCFFIYSVLLLAL